MHMINTFGMILKPFLQYKSTCNNNKKKHMQKKYNNIYIYMLTWKVKKSFGHAMNEKRLGLEDTTANRLVLYHRLAIAINDRFMWSQDDVWTMFLFKTVILQTLNFLLSLLDLLADESNLILNGVPDRTTHF